MLKYFDGCNLLYWLTITRPDKYIFAGKRYAEASGYDCRTSHGWFTLSWNGKLCQSHCPGWPWYVSEADVEHLYKYIFWIYKIMKCWNKKPGFVIYSIVLPMLLVIRHQLFNFLISNLLAIMIMYANNASSA